MIKSHRLSPLKNVPSSLYQLLLFRLFGYLRYHPSKLQHLLLILM